jgi:hypothetical protein
MNYQNIEIWGRTYIIECILPQLCFSEWNLLIKKELGY